MRMSVMKTAYREGRISQVWGHVDHTRRRKPFDRVGEQTRNGLKIDPPQGLNDKRFPLSRVFPGARLARSPANGPATLSAVESGSILSSDHRHIGAQSSRTDAFWRTLFGAFEGLQSTGCFIIVLMKRDGGSHV